MSIPTRKSGRHFLQIPGPTPIPDRVLRAMDYQVLDHRGPKFQELAKRVIEKTKTIFKTKQNLIIFPASGSGAWEAGMTNTLNPGDKVLMYETGQFSTLWEQLAQRLGFKTDFNRQRLAHRRRSAEDLREARRRQEPRDQGGLRGASRDLRAACCRTSRPSARRSTTTTIRRCSWSTPCPASARPICASTNGRSTSWWPARRRA